MTYTPRYSNTVALLNHAIEKHPERPLFGSRQNYGWHFISYAEFGELVNAARSGLLGLGIAPGDRVAVISDNRLEWAVGSFATLSCGAIYVPMYQAQSDKDVRYILHDSGAKLCFCANAQIAARVRALQPELPELKHVIEFASEAYDALLERGRKQPLPSALPHDQDIAFLIYTSGTTGDPKGVELTHYNLASTASGIIEVAPLRDEGELTLAFLPWAHVFGGCVEIAVLIGYGGAIAICDNTERLLDYLAEVKPTALFAVPRIWNRVYENVNKQIEARPKPVQQLLRTGLRARRKAQKDEPLTLAERGALLVTNALLIRKIQARLGGRVRFAVSGAAALAPEVAEFIDSLGIVVLEGYGLTESTAAGTASKPDERKIGSVGKALPGMRVVIDQNAAGLAPGEGEIILYGGGVMRGYHNQPELTRAAFTPDGGLRTGDLGRIDDEGYLFITGRVKELYKLSNGKYVAPVALEEKLQLSPFIAQCFIYGSDQPHNTAVIIPDMTALAEWAHAHQVPGTERELLAQPAVRELIRNEIDRLSRDFKGFEQVRDFVLDSEPFTVQNDLLTHSLKLKRRNALAKYRDKLVALYRDRSHAA